MICIYFKGMCQQELDAQLRYQQINGWDANDMKMILRVREFDFQAAKTSLKKPTFKIPLRRQQQQQQQHTSFKQDFILLSHFIFKLQTYFMQPSRALTRASPTSLFR